MKFINKFQKGDTKGNSEDSNSSSDMEDNEMQFISKRTHFPHSKGMQGDIEAVDSVRLNSKHNSPILKPKPCRLKGVKIKKKMVLGEKSKTILKFRKSV